MAMEQNGIQTVPEDTVVSNIQVKVQPSIPNSDSPTKSVSSSELSSSLTTLGLEKKFEVTTITDETTFDKIKLKTLNMNFPTDVSIYINVESRGS